MNYAKQFLVRPDSKFDLRDHDPELCDGLEKNDPKVIERLEKNAKRIQSLQYCLYAENARGLLIVLQAMDAGGKDGTIRHVCSAMNPQGCRVEAFKAPTEEELAHDFLWRVHRATPRKGQIVVFNRSHYEDVLVVRVHNLVPKAIWSQRYAQINEFEELLSESGIHILKFFLHISKDEQLERLKSRLEDPEKYWKVQPGDFDERKRWDEYQEAFEAALSKCSQPHAPWFVVPANKKWFRNLVVSEIIADALEGYNMKMPKATVDVSKIRAE